MENPGCRTTSQLISGQPEPDVFVTVLFAQVVGQLLQTFNRKKQKQ